MIQQKLKTLSELSKQTTGGSFQLLHLDSGAFKVRFNNRCVQPSTTASLKEYKVEEFEQLLEDAIAHIQSNRQPNTDPEARKPYTLFKPYA